MTTHLPSRFARRVAPLLASVLAVAACSIGSNSGDDLRAALDTIAQAGASRVHALVVDDGSPSAASAGPEAAVGEPVLETYEIGLSTEPFVATVALQLVAEGHLSLDTPLTDLLQRVDAPQGASITLRQLLQHTSGLRDDTTEATAAEPPTQTRYAAVNYDIIATLIESRTGQSWTEHVRTRILEPLALDHTNIAARPDTPWSDPGGTTLTTPGDVQRFFEALLTGELLAPAQRAEMQQTVPAVGATHLGLGLVQRDLSCDLAVWGHASTTAGYRSITAFTSDGRHGIVLSNATITHDSTAVAAQESAALDVIDEALC